MAQQAKDSDRRYSFAGLYHLDISPKPGTLGLKAKRMFDDWTKRAVVAIVVGALVTCLLVIWGPAVVVSRLTSNPEDPLTKAGGLSPAQKGLSKMSD